MKETTQLRNLIKSKQFESIMEAHNALSARIVEEVGFKGIWASGLSISAALGVRDNNEASWTQVLDVLEFMSDATSIPILLDGDTGYGNFNNARRLVRKLEQKKVAGVCIEDKLFPKTNSFIRGEAQALADIDEFCGKIKAMKDTQLDEDFIVVSRVEAFIAGWGLKEALKRAEAYRKAGSDAVLIHSNRSDLSEIESFIKEWGDRLPVIIVPTKYYTVPTAKFRELGVSLAIWANHNLRASIKAMKQTSSQIFRDESLINVENNVSPIEEIFRLQREEELEAAEKIYLTSPKKSVNSIILIREKEDHPLITEQTTLFKTLGFKDVYKIGDSEFDAPPGELPLLHSAIQKLEEKTIVSYGELIYKSHVLEELMVDENDITLVVDADYDIHGKSNLFVIGKQPYSKMLYSKTVDLISISNRLNLVNIHGEFIGLWKISGNGIKIVNGALEHLSKREDYSKLTLADLFTHIQAAYPISIKYIKGSWLDLETYRVIKKAGGNK